jgi:hypothetical protein
VHVCDLLVLKEKYTNKFYYESIKKNVEIDKGPIYIWVIEKMTEKDPRFSCTAAE